MNWRASRSEGTSLGEKIQKNSPAATGEHAICFIGRMHLNPAILRHPSVLTRSIPRNSNPALRGPVGSPQASAEIHAFIAARDMALAEAERNPADMTLNRAFLANQLVQNCLQPPRSPYQAQALA